MSCTPLTELSVSEKNLALHILYNNSLNFYCLLQAILSVHTAANPIARLSPNSNIIPLG